MAVITQRLTHFGVSLPAVVDDNKRVHLKERIQNEPIDAIRRVVRHHKTINFEYAVLCAQLAHRLASSHENTQELREQVLEAFGISVLLEHVYCHYYPAEKQVKRLREEQVKYREYLLHSGYRIPEHTDTLGQANKATSVEATIRQQTDLFNWRRVFTARSRRLFIAFLPFTHDVLWYQEAVRVVDQYAAPTLNYLGWLFFTPRLIANLVATAERVIPNSTMSNEERALGWQTRLAIEMEQRWFELAHDSAWFVSNFLLCFVFTGTLGPIGILVSVGVQAFDTILAAIRCHVELSPLYALQRQYDEMLASETIADETKGMIRDYQVYLAEQIDYEQRRLAIRAVNSAIQLLAISMLLPALVVFPALPLVGAILAVLGTFAFYMADRWVEQQKPLDKLPDFPKPPALAPASQARVEPKAEKASTSSQVAALHGSRSDGDISRYAQPPSALGLT